MWQMFTKVMPDTTNDQSRSALTLLGMVGNVEPNIIIDNVKVLVEHGLTHGDLKMAHDTCMTLSKIGNNLTSKSSASPDSNPQRFSPDDIMFDKIEKLLTECIDKKNDDQYIPMAQQAITCLYLLSDHPDEMAGSLCRKLSQKLAQEPKNALLLRRTFFVIGHIAVSHLNYLDCGVFGELKRRNALREQKVRRT